MAKRFIIKLAKPDQVGLELAVVVAVQGCLVLVPLHPQPPKPRNSDEEVPRPPRKQEQARPLQLAPEKRGGGLGGAAVVEEVVLLVEEGVEIARAVALAEPRVLQCLGWGLPLAYQVTPSKLLLGPAAVVVVALLIGQMWAGQAGLAMILALRLELGVAEVFVVVAVWMAWAALHHLQVGQLVSSLAGKVACTCVGVSEQIAFDRSPTKKVQYQALPFDSSQDASCSSTL